MGHVAQFERLVSSRGSLVTYHREDGGVPCPCRTPEGYRDLKWHRDNPTEPMCNEKGMLPATVTNLAVRAFVQPVQAGAVRRMTSEYAQQLFGEVEMDDHLGIFPLEWGGTTLDFYDWPQGGADFILHDGRRFGVVSANKIPDPADGNMHHWEVGLRLLTNVRNP